MRVESAGQNLRRCTVVMSCLLKILSNDFTMIMPADLRANIFYMFSHVAYHVDFLWGLSGNCFLYELLATPGRLLTNS